MDHIADGLEKAIKAIKIGVSSTEQEQLHRELDQFLDWLEPMLEVDPGDLEGLLFSHDAVNVLREDSPRKSGLAELQEAAPNFAGGFYLVPKIME